MSARSSVTKSMNSFRSSKRKYHEKHIPPSLAFIWVGKRISKIKTCLCRVVSNHVTMPSFDESKIPCIICPIEFIFGKDVYSTHGYRTSGS